MNPLIVLTAVFAAACAAPAPGEYAVAAAAPVAVAAAPVAVAAAPVAVNVPAPYTTAEVRGAPVTTISQAAPVISKQVHFGKTQFVSGYASAIHKPAIPDFKITVPTVLKGSVAVNPAIVKNVKELHVVNEPVPVERPYNVPYDVPVVKTHIEEVAVPVHVDKPYAAPYAVPVEGEPIVNYRQTAPIVQRTHSNVVAAPAVAHVGYAAAAPAVGVAGYAAAAPAVGVAGYAAAAPAVGVAGYAAAAPVGVAGYAAAAPVAVAAKY